LRSPGDDELGLPFLGLEKTCRLRALLHIEECEAGPGFLETLQQFIRTSLNDPHEGAPTGKVEEGVAAVELEQPRLPTCDDTADVHLTAHYDFDSLSQSGVPPAHPASGLYPCVDLDSSKKRQIQG
jgi:hypothetical protein